MPSIFLGLSASMAYNLALVTFLVTCVRRIAQTVEVEFENRCQVNIELWWLGADDAALVGQLPAGGGHGVNSFKGHIFEFRDPSSKVPYGKVQVEAAGRVHIQRCEEKAKIRANWETFSGPHGMMKRQLEKYAKLYDDEKFKPLAKKWQEDCQAAYPGDEAVFCDPWLPGNNHAVGQLLIPRSDWEKENEREQKDRLHLISTQPSKLPQFTEKGYTVREWPKSEQDLLKSILDAIPPARKKAKPSDYSLFNAYVSAWESDVWVVEISHQLRAKLNNMIQGILEEWCGYKLTHTQTHGPRIYRNGSVLNMHVDRFTTHIVSAIVILTQADLKSPWPLEIVNLAGSTKHLTTEKPGTIILYESAKLLHGRPYPLQGKEYVNIFLHFKPVGWENPQQWLKEVRKDKPQGWQPSWDPGHESRAEL